MFMKPIKIKGVISLNKLKIVNSPDKNMAQCMKLDIIIKSE